MSAGRRISTWLAGRNTLTPISTSRPPLILRVTMPVTTSSLVDGLHHLQPGFDLLGLALAEGDHAARFVDAAVDVFDVFDQHLDVLRRLAGSSSPSSHSLRGDDAFALVADVDQHEVVVDAQNLAVDDLVDGQLAAAPIDLLGGGAAHGQGQLVFPLVLLRIQAANQVTIYHVFWFLPATTENGSPSRDCSGAVRRGSREKRPAPQPDPRHGDRNQPSGRIEDYTRHKALGQLR